MENLVDTAFRDIEAFLEVAQQASFTRAAEGLGTSKSNVGKSIQRMEKRLGTRLFQRTTRAVRLTEDGEIYLSAARIALEGLRDAEQSLAARRSEPIGKVRIDLPAGFGRLLFPVLSALRIRNPKLSFEMALNDRMSDPIAEGWDIVVRIGHLPSDGEITVRKLCDLNLGLYAAPSYLESHNGVSLADLSQHDAVVFRGPSGRLRPWSLLDGNHIRELFPTATLTVADGHAMVEAAVDGFGLAQIHDRVAQPHVDAGRLIHVLPESDVPGPPVHAMIPLGQRMPAKTRAVLNCLADYLRGPDDKQTKTRGGSGEELKPMGLLARASPT